MIYLRAWLGAFVAFLVIDLAWIVLVVRRLYEQEVGGMLRESPDMAASALFYVAYTAGIVYLAVQPALQAATIKPALLRGAVFGALAYGTYTVTNYAVFESWTMILVISDIPWGAFLTAACAACGYLAARR